MDERLSTLDHVEEKFSSESRPLWLMNRVPAYCCPCVNQGFSFFNVPKARAMASGRDVKDTWCQTGR
jgi:hypothetical protein